MDSYLNIEQRFHEILMKSKFKQRTEIIEQIFKLGITLQFQKRCQPIALVFQIIALDQFRFNVMPFYSEDQTVKKNIYFLRKKIESVSLMAWKCPRNRNLITLAIWKESLTIISIQYLVLPQGP